MTNTVLYASSDLLDKITKIAAKNFEIDYKDVELIAPVRKNLTEFNKKKNTRQPISEFYFEIYNSRMEKVGDVSTTDIQNFSKPKKAEADNG